jgi:hypothetical protein
MLVNNGALGTLTVGAVPARVVQTAFFLVLEWVEEIVAFCTVFEHCRKKTT